MGRFIHSMENNENNFSGRVYGPEYLMPSEEFAIDMHLLLMGGKH